MADQIKGITVEIGGNTAGLNKALQSTNKEINGTQKELREVEKALKLDPTNTDLLRQKQELLAKSVQETKVKVDALKAAKEKADADMANGTEVNQEQYRKLQREIVTSEDKLKGLETQADKSNVALSKISAGASNLSSAAGKVAGATAPATLAIAGLGAAAFNAASDMAESQNKVDVAFGDSANKVKEFADTTLDTYGISKGTALDMSALFGDMATSMGLTQPAAADMSTNLTGLAGDLASFKNIGIDEATTALKGVFTGETESLKNIGVVMTQTNLDAYALANGFGKTTKDMTEAEKVQLRYAYVMDATKNAQGDFERTSDGAANSLRVMQESAKEASAELGEVLLPIITPIIQKITDLIKWFSGLDDGQKKIIVTIAALVAAISPVAGIISAVAGAISFLCANPIVLLIAAIVGLVALIATKGDEIQAVLKKVDDFMQNIFAVDFSKILGPVLGGVLNAFMENVKNIWDAIVKIFNGVIDIIRGVFTGDWERAWKGVIEIFGGLFDGLVAIAKAPLNGIIGLLNGAVGAINSLIDGFNRIGFTMPKWLGGGSWHPNLPNIPSIPYLAKGGTVLSGSAVVGEAGPELLTVLGNKTMVQPLTSQQKNVSYGGNVINVYGAVGQDVSQLAEIVADKINANVQQKGAAFA